MAKEQKAPKELDKPDAPDVLNPGNTENTDSETGKETNPGTKTDGVHKTGQKKAIKAFEVVAKRAGFRRAGFAFGSEKTILPAGDLTAEQIKQLKEEPMLVVTDITE